MSLKVMAEWAGEALPIEKNQLLRFSLLLVIKTSCVHTDSNQRGSQKLFHCYLVVGLAYGGHTAILSKL